LPGKIFPVVNGQRHGSLLILENSTRWKSIYLLTRPSASELPRADCPSGTPVAPASRSRIRTNLRTNLRGRTRNHRDRHDVISNFQKIHRDGNVISEGIIGRGKKHDPDRDLSHACAFNRTNPNGGRYCSRLPVRRCSVKFCARFRCPARALPSSRIGQSARGFR
jgi:hypothetical protein